MKLVLLISTILFSLASHAESPVDTRSPTEARCDASEEAIAAHRTCEEEYQANNCAEFAEESGAADSIVNCQDYLTGTPTGDSIQDVLSGCTDGTVKAFNDAVDWVEGIPERWEARQSQVRTISNRALDTCRKQNPEWGNRFPAVTYAGDVIPSNLDILRQPRSGDFANMTLFRQAYTQWDQFNSCYRSTWDRFNEPQFPDIIPSLEEMKAALNHLDGMRRCFKPEKQAEIVCPVVASILVGTAVGASVAGIRSGVMRAVKSSRRNRLGGSDAELESDIEEYMASANTADLPEKERLSLAHQEDLLSVTRNPTWSAAMDEMGVDRRAMTMGMMDSDMGKLDSYVGRYFRDDTPESNELLDVLAGRSSTPAGVEMRRILDENGFEGQNFLPGNLSNAEIRDVIKTNPTLVGYFHEMPGMHNAFRALNNGEITPEQFRGRMRANMFHNGPHAGFWQIFGDVIIPNTSQNVFNDPRMNTFFRGTVFDSGNDTDTGFRTPRYPSPVSAEGLVHTLADRFSQGTAGGIQKIARELGGAPYVANPRIPLGQLQMGANTVYESLIGNPTKTLAQFDALDASSRGINLTPQQLNAFTGLSSQARARVQRQIAFFNERVEVLETGGTPPAPTRFRVQFTDANGNTVNRVIDGETPTDEAFDIMDRLTEAEEAVNGRAFEDFGVTPPPNRLARNTLLGTAAGAVAAPLCEDADTSVTGPPATTDPPSTTGGETLIQ